MTEELTLQWLGAAHFHLSRDRFKVVTDPLFTRLPGERPRLETSRDDLQQIDLLLLTHGHLDHSADFPFLVERHRPPAYAPQEVLTSLQSQGIDADWSRCHSLESLKGTSLSHGDVVVTPYQIGTEQIDLWFIRSMFVRPWRHWRPQAIPFGIRWLRHHLRCNCFAFHLRLPGGTTLLFFGNLTPSVDELAAVDRVDLLAIPYCPANSKWPQQTLDLIDRFQPAVTLVHHFDNFMHPYTHSRYMDLGRYQLMIQERFPDVRICFAKFNQPMKLQEIMNQY
jgi:L-ascorbate metabolism protein UlaG (beta-lactamase superfamily)